MFVGLLGLAQTSKAEPAQPRSGRAKPKEVYDNMLVLVCPAREEQSRTMGMSIVLCRFELFWFVLFSWWPGLAHKSEPELYVYAC